MKLGQLPSAGAHPPGHHATEHDRGANEPKGLAALLENPGDGRTRHGISRLHAQGGQTTSARVLTIGLVNNTPDAGAAATERQFRHLIAGAAGSTPVRLRLFSLPGIQHAETEAHHSPSDVGAWHEIWKGGLDGLIVTGTEPVAADLRDEPYWSALAELIDWAEAGAISTLFSCLAAHASVLHVDGIPRQPFAEKRFGVFEHMLVSAHPLSRGIRAPFRIPHSRWNGLDEAALVDCGYRILSRSADAGIDMFVRQRRSLTLHFQGHPEYESATLLLQYRRDVRRFLTGARDEYPGLPQFYLAPRLARRLLDFRRRALDDRREVMLAEFPRTAAVPSEIAPWHAAASTIIGNWLDYIRERAH